MALSAAVLALGDCAPHLPVTPQPKEEPPTPSARAIPNADILIRREVERLAQNYGPDTIIRKVYLGGSFEGLSPIFNLPIPVRLAPEGVYATTIFGQATYNPGRIFRYILEADGSVSDYAILQHQQATIAFSSAWLSSSDQVKALAFEKEPFTIAIWESFSQIVLNIYLAQGRLHRFDQTVSIEEIARTLARNLIIENRDAHKLYDYAGYFVILPKVGRLLTLEDPIINQQLNYSNLPEIYQRAIQANIPFERLSFPSEQFFDLAFNPESTWAKIILDPRLPGPPPSLRHLLTT